MQMMVNSRWMSLLSDCMYYDSWKNYHKFCGIKEDAILNSKQIIEIAKEDANFVHENLLQIQPGLNTELSYFKAVRDIELADYLERKTSMSIGVENVMSFFNFCFDPEFD